jgi:iron-sulfur cluster assembly protein
LTGVDGCGSFAPVSTMTADSNPIPAAPFRLGDERLVRLTPAAARRVRELLAEQGRGDGVLRVTMVGGGCSGLRYQVELQDAPARRDIVVATGGARVVVDSRSVPYVAGSEVDFVAAGRDGGFKVTNPNLTPTCSCDQLA